MTRRVITNNENIQNKRRGEPWKLLKKVNLKYLVLHNKLLIRYRYYGIIITEIICKVIISYKLG